MAVKIIFLDFDGPIIPRIAYTAAHTDGKRVQAWPDCVAQLNRITDATGAVIVVSSTWRLDGLVKTRERLNAWGVKAACIGITPRLHKSEKDHQEIERGHEIQYWLDNYGSDVDSFVILDDDKDMVHLLPRLVHTPFDNGITVAHADQAIAMLGRR